MTLSGTYDAASGVITGTGFGTTSGGGVSGSGEGDWTATVDPVAGTIAAIAGDNEATFDLTFTPVRQLTPGPVGGSVGGCPISGSVSRCGQTAVLPLQLALEHLARHVPRERLVADDEVARQLEVGQVGSRTPRGPPAP